MSEHFIRSDGTEVYCCEHEIGLKITNISKKELFSKFIIVVVDYGWMYNSFTSRFNDEAIKIPFGTAHLLEHIVVAELNERLKTSGFSNSISLNAKTSNNKTTFEFTISDEVESIAYFVIKNLLSLNIRDENICREKKIVLNEYFYNKGNIERQVLINLLVCMFGEEYIGKDPLGNEESIDKIEHTILREVYQNMYVVNNMQLVVIGKIDKKCLFDKLSKEELNIRKGTVYLEKNWAKNFLSEKKYIKIKNDFIKNDIFVIGVKNLMSFSTNIQFFKTDICLKILLQIIISNINNNRKFNCCPNILGGVYTHYDYEYLFLKGYGDLELFLKTLDEVLGKLDREILEENKYIHLVDKIIKEKNEAVLCELDLYELANNVTFKGTIIEYLSCYNEISCEYLRKVYSEYFDRKNIYVSVISYK